LAKVVKDKKNNKIKREFVGNLVKISGTNTIKIRVEEKFPHPKYGKIIKKHRSFLAHYEGDMKKLNIGDLVRIRSRSPISKMKTWEFVEVTKKVDIIQ
jgi:small subunit ribosomal protein S17